MNSARGQSGLDRLLVFVVAAIVVVAALPTVLGFAGIDVRPAPENTTSETPSTPTPEPASLVVLNASGIALDEANQTVGAVTLTVTKAGSSASVDVGDVTATWANGGVYTVVAPESERATADATFGVDVQHISNSSGVVLAETGDRATLTFDLGADDVDDVPEFGDELDPGDSVDVVLATGAGETTTVSIAVPESLDGKAIIGL